MRVLASISEVLQERYFDMNLTHAFCFADTTSNDSDNEQQSWTLPQELKNLDLKVFVISNRAIEGSVGGTFDSWSGLKRLDLSGNSIVGALPVFGGTTHPNLETIDLASNQFSGPIPSEYETLASLGKSGISRGSILFTSKRI